MSQNDPKIVEQREPVLRTLKDLRTKLIILHESMKPSGPGRKILSESERRVLSESERGALSKQVQDIEYLIDCADDLELIADSDIVTKIRRLLGLATKAKERTPALEIVGKLINSLFRLSPDVGREGWMNAATAFFRLNDAALKYSEAKKATKRFLDQAERPGLWLFGIPGDSSEGSAYQLFEELVTILSSYMETVNLRPLPSCSRGIVAEEMATLMEALADDRHSAEGAYKVSWEALGLANTISEAAKQMPLSQ